LDVYLRASPGVSVRGCLRVFEILRGITKIDNLTIHVRSDAWFMEDDQYPLFAAFTKPLAIPNELDYLTASRLSCSFVRDKVRCSGQNFVE